MRFRIENRSWNRNAPYRLRFGGAAVQVKCPVLSKWFWRGYSEMSWTWTNGKEYSLLCRVVNPGVKPIRQIVSDGNVLCQGQVIVPFAGRPRIEWNLNNDMFLC